ncbi:hypothetical protein PAERUG_E16_London_17_VIM_2_04_14_05141 [Pseudomonas aeruginosa]|nr:hypothetical protein PAERUG_E16_London_17_VIM_2_04_14_05141 [Pseudomonas aeruginosa]
MRSQLFGVGAQHRGGDPRRIEPTDRADHRPAAAVAFRAAAGQRQAGLAAGHRQVDVGEDLGVEQRAVQVAAGVVHAVALAQRIEVVALARMALAGHQQGIQHRAVLGHVRAVLLAQQGELVVDEADIERRVVDDQLGAADEFEEIVGDLAEARLVLQVFVGDAVDGDRPFVDLAIGLQVDVEVATGQAAPLQLDTADLDDPVTIGHRHAGGFGIQYDATHL